jgi:molecular chaperone GrpE
MTSAQHDVAAETAERNRTPSGQDEPVASSGTDAVPDMNQASVMQLLEDRWRRTVAELDNTRKRYERQLAEQARAERAKTAAAFLPVLDNLELALRHADADPAAIVSGVVAVHAQTVNVLSGLGLHRVDPVGERFDPARHEAARVVPASENTAAGTVVEVLRPGFAGTDGTVVRPAVVTVAQQQEQS